VKQTIPSPELPTTAADKSVPKKSFLKEGVRTSNLNPKEEEKKDDPSPRSGNKKQAAKFRSMDFSSSGAHSVSRTGSASKAHLNRGVRSKGTGLLEETPDLKTQEVLSDLQEASREGGNSISLSPQRTQLIDAN